MSASVKKKHARFVDVAMQCANRSRHMRQRHGAVLVKGSKIISTGCNSYTAGTSCTPGNVHAEVHCLRNADIPQDCCLIMYVVRVNSIGDLRESKPCKNCQKVLHKFKVHTVFHSISAV